MKLFTKHEWNVRLAGGVHTFSSIKRGTEISEGGVHIPAIRASALGARASLLGLLRRVIVNTSIVKEKQPSYHLLALYTGKNLIQIEVYRNAFVKIY